MEPNDMEWTLNDVETRVLGCLIEKERTTPDYYPLTLNALTNACNQKSNRDPVLSLEETTVVRGLDGLGRKELVTRIHKADSRIPKYQHTIEKILDLQAPELAVLCELMLRGPQTVGELRGRSSRMHPFASIDEVAVVLAGLAEKAMPLVVQMPRQPGRKERRFAHLLAGVPDLAEESPEIRPEPATLQVRTEDERLKGVEEEIASLRAELASVRSEFEAFRLQFEE